MTSLSMTSLILCKFFPNFHNLTLRLSIPVQMFIAIRPQTTKIMGGRCIKPKHVKNSSVRVGLCGIEFEFGMKLFWDNKHQPNTSLFLQLGCQGNHNDTLITSLYAY